MEKYFLIEEIHQKKLEKLLKENPMYKDWILKDTITFKYELDDKEHTVSHMKL
ncbi:hypothetical protein ACWV26_11605 [Rummeliibacillus sp. JY-2-4R]